MPKKILTKKKERWAKNRNVSLRGIKLSYNASLQSRYESSLRRLVNDMTKEVKKEIVRLFNSDSSKDFFKNQKKISAIDESIGSQARILMNALTDKFSQLFNMKAKDLSEAMLSNTEKASKSNLYTSLKQLSGGLSLKTGIVTKGMEDVLKALIEENISLIKSIPQQYFKDITGSVMRSITTGQGLYDLIPEIEKYQGITDRRAKNIALDQTRKAYNTINKQRMTTLGVKQFEWVHSAGGQHPRESHMMIDGKIFSFEKLIEEQSKLGVPEHDRGLPGEPINCKCTILPIIDFDSED